MKYLKTYELKETFYVLMAKKDKIDDLIYITNKLKQNKIKFKVHDSGNKNKKYYFIITKKPFVIDSIFLSYNDNDLSEYGDEIDYEVIISSEKFNL